MKRELSDLMPNNVQKEIWNRNDETLLIAS